MLYILLFIFLYFVFYFYISVIPHYFISYAVFGTQLVTPGANYMISIPLNTVLKKLTFTVTEIAPEGIEVKLFIILTGNTESMKYHNNIHLTQIENDCKSFAGEILKS